MASDLMLPEGMAPSNLHLRPSAKARYIDGDMFNICERLAEISTRLYIVELVEGDGATYAIMEACDDGVQRQVIRADALDDRVLTSVQYLLHVPFEKRYAVAEAESDKREQDHHDAKLEEIYERMGGQFRWQLEHDGFIAHRGVSYAKKGVAQPKRHR